MISKNMTTIANYSVFLVVAVALYEWGVSINWELTDLNKLNVFPLFGLVAFSIMWWHFLIGYLTDKFSNFKKSKQLKGLSSVFVFFLIILHPMLLFLQSGASSLDGYKEFVELYIGNTNFIFVSYGTVAFLIFLAYDLAKRFKNTKFFRKNWLIVDSIDDVAFIAVFVHSMMLGRHTADGWFRYYWIALGLSGMFFIAYKNWKRFQKRDEAQQA